MLNLKKTFQIQFFFNFLHKNESLDTLGVNTGIYFTGIYFCLLVYTFIFISPVTGTSVLATAKRKKSIMTIPQLLRKT